MVTVNIDILAAILETRFVFVLFCFVLFLLQALQQSDP